MTDGSAPRRSARPLLFWMLLTVGLAFAARPLPWREAAEQLRHVRLSWVLVALLANFVVLPLWALEWRILSPRALRVGFRAMFEIIAVTAAVLNSVPFFAGEATGVAMLVMRAKLSRSAAVSVLAMDQLLVGFAKITVLAAAAFHAPLPPWVRGGLTSLLAAVGVLGAMLVLLAHRGERIRHRLAKRDDVWRRLAARVAGIGANLETLKTPRLAGAVAVLALLKKGAELSAIIAIQVAFGMDASLPVALLALAALSVTTLLPVTPANLGVYEATVFATYRYAGVSPETALGIAVVQHLCALLPSLATGYVTLALRQLVPQRASAT